MQMIDAARVHDILDYPGFIAALRTAHLGGMPDISDRIMYEQTHANGLPDNFIILPAWQRDEGILAKLTTVFPRNKEQNGLPTVNSIYAFINGETGVTEAVMDGEAMIFRKTSADSALGSEILSRPDSKTLLLLGAGGLAPYMVMAHRSVRPSIETVLVWNRTRKNAEALVEGLANDGVSVETVDDLAEAVGAADIISSATSASQPIIPGARLRPGTHVDLVGSFKPDMREADDDVLRRAEIFVDHRQTTERSGEFLGPFERKVIAPDDIKGDLFELCQGKVAGRSGPDAITMMKNGGGSHMDYYAAKYVMDRLHGREFSTSCALTED